MKNIPVILFSLLFSFGVLSKTIIIPPTENSQEQIQEAMILAKPGDVIQLSSGIYYIEDGLSLDIDDVIISGEGHQNTVLDFSNQMTGAHGNL